MNAPPILFLDSASVDDAREAASLGFVAGITTNPSLIAQEGRPAAQQIGALLDVFPGLVFHQPATTDPLQARAEIDGLVAVGEQRLVAKLPALPQMFPLAVAMLAAGVPCAITAVYSEGQAFLAEAVGARWVIPYVNRAKRLMEDGANLVPTLASLLAGRPGRPLILAASIKSVEEAAETIRAGADAVSLPMAVLRDLAVHPLTVSAVEAFLE